MWDCPVFSLYQKMSQWHFFFISHSLSLRSDGAAVLKLYRWAFTKDVFQVTADSTVLQTSKLSPVFVDSWTKLR